MWDSVLALVRDGIVLIGSTGGLWFLVDRFLKRPRVRVRWIQSGRRIEFEIENVGERITSLEPTIDLVARSIFGEKKRYQFEITEANRTLPSHEARRFVADAIKPKDDLNFLWFANYRLRLTSGRDVRVRTVNVMSGAVSFWRQFKERARMRFFERSGPTYRELERELGDLQRALREAGHQVVFSYNAEKGHTLALDGRDVLTAPDLRKLRDRVREVAKERRLLK